MSVRSSAASCARRIPEAGSRSACGALRPGARCDFPHPKGSPTLSRPTSPVANNSIILHPILCSYALNYAHRPVPARSDWTFTILLPSWNNLPYLQLALRSIRRHSAFVHQVVVHVNEGTDGTLEWLAGQPDVAYTHTPENVGVCYALNLARSLAATDYLLYLNDDMYLLPGWDVALRREVQALGHPWFYLSGTLIEPANTGNPCVIVKDYGPEPDSFREADLLREYAHLPKGDWQGATWPPNLVHRAVWDLVGGMSIEYFPGMYSDPDFSRKLWAVGVRHFKGLGDSRAYHFGSKSVSRIRRNDGRKTFVRKWGLSPRSFTRHFLRRGEPFDGPLSEPQLSWKDRWVNRWKAR